MTDKVYPSSKTTQTTIIPPLPPPPNKIQLPTTTTKRHPYRPNPTTIHHSRRRNYFCLCCFWSILIIILLLLITTIAGCILYLLYRPHRPSFSIAAVKISEFNLTTAGDDTTHLTSKFNLTISTKNPNKKITFFYDTIKITCLTRDTLIANGSFRNPFISNPNNVTVHRSTLYGNSVFIETEDLNKIKSDLKKKSGMPLNIILDTDLRVKIESITSKKIGIRIKCEGIHSLIPKSNSKNSTSASAAANVSAAKCKVDLRIKMWKWTF